MNALRSSRHVDTAAALDYLEERLTPARRRAVEAHLGLPCAACRERVRELATLVERLRSDALAPVPAELHRRALAVFAAEPAPAPTRGAAGRLLQLVFDSLRDPMPVAARRAVGEAHRLRWTHGDWSLDLECEAEGSDLIALRGRLGRDDAALHRVEVLAGRERFSCWPDGEGAFALDGVPRRRLQISVIGPAGRWRVPPFTP